MSSDQGDHQSKSQDNDRWKFAIFAIGIIVVALLPALPPGFFDAAVVLALLALFAGSGPVRRVLNQLPKDDQRRARWSRAFGLIGIFVVALLLLPPHLRVIALVLGVLVIMALLGGFPDLRAGFPDLRAGFLTYAPHVGVGSQGMTIIMVMASL